VEVRDDIGALNILADLSDFTVSLCLVTAVEIGKRKLEDTALESLRCNLYNSNK
jgi:hypothetical protein